MIFVRELSAAPLFCGRTVDATSSVWLSLLNVPFLMSCSCVICSVGLFGNMKRWQREDSPWDGSVDHCSL